MHRRCLQVITTISLFFFYMNLLHSAEEMFEGSVSLKVNNRLLTDNLWGYFDEAGYPKIELKALMEELGIKEYEVIKENITYTLNGKPVNRRAKITPIDGKSYLDYREIEKFIPDSEASWDISKMMITLETKTEMPWEFLMNQERARKRLDNREEDNVIEEGWKGFTPGILNLGYSKYDMEKSDSRINLNFNNQILYGSASINASYYDSSWEIDNFLWERSIGKGRKFVLGDTYRSTPFNVGESGSFRGVSIQGRDSWDYTHQLNGKTLEGQAPNGSTVELYENGILRGYQTVTNGMYRFDVKTTGGARNYELWIYNQDGTITKNTVSLYGEQDLIEVGTFDYELQLGVDSDRTENEMYNGSLSYGFTEDFTLKGGVYNSNLDNSSLEKRFLNINPIYRIGGSRGWSSVFAGDLSFNSEDTHENFYHLFFRSGNSKITNTIGVENYDNLTKTFLNESYLRKFYWRNKFTLFGINTSLAYEREEDDTEDLDRYSISMFNSYFRGLITISTDLERERIKKINGDKSTEDSLNTSLSYSIRDRRVNKLVDRVVLDYSINEDDSDTYGISLHKSKGFGDSYDYYIKWENDDNENRVELSLTYRIGTWGSIGTDMRKDDTGSVTGVELRTAVDFSRKGKIHYTDYSGDSSVKGRVFIDKNGNNTYDEGEEPVENIEVVNSTAFGVSNKEGDYHISMLSSGVNHKLSIKNHNPDYVLEYLVPEKYVVKTLPGGLMTLDIPIKQLKTVIGMLEFSDDFYYEEVAELLLKMEVRVREMNTGREEVIKLTDENFIVNLPQGEYELELIYEGDEISILQTEYRLDMNGGEDSEEYLDFIISKVDKTLYSLDLKHNGTRMYSLKKLEKSKLELSKGGKNDQKIFNNN